MILHQFICSDPYTCGLSSRRSVWFPKQNNRYFSCKFSAIYELTCFSFKRSTLPCFFWSHPNLPSRLQMQLAVKSIFSRENTAFKAWKIQLFGWLLWVCNKSACTFHLPTLLTIIHTELEQWRMGRSIFKDKRTLCRPHRSLERTCSRLCKGSGCESKVPYWVGFAPSIPLESLSGLFQKQ